jgi:hypothetical protein
VPDSNVGLYASVCPFQVGVADGVVAEQQLEHGVRQRRPHPRGNPTFFSSSSANLTQPATTVLYAQLSWGARTRAGTNGSNAPAGQVGQMQFRVPGASTCQTISASNVYRNDPSVSDGMYRAFANVTSVVQQAGSGTDWGANSLAATGQDRYAGWSLVVVISDPAQPLRDLS